MPRTRSEEDAMVKKLSVVSILMLGWALPAPAIADIRVFACEPEWAALAQEIGGDKVSTYSATHERLDPHHIRARPSLIAKIRRADLVFCSGAGLEIGWLPLLMKRGARSNVRPGKPGHLMAARHVAVREIPTVIDRSLGDIHPEGNPHVHLDPRNLALLARELAKRLSMIDAENKALYSRNLRSFENRWDTHMKQWNMRAAKLKNMPIVVHHRSWSYLIGWLGLNEIGSLEAKPGIPPTVSHLNRLLKTASTAKARAILRTPFDQPDPSNWLANRTGIPALVLPFTVSRNAKHGALGKLFDDILTQLEKANGRP